MVVQRSDDRSYIVETAEGTRYRRNRYHLRKIAESAPVPSEVGEVAIETECEDPNGGNGTVEKLPSPGSEAMRNEAGTPSPAKHQPETSKPAGPQRVRKTPAYFSDNALG